MRATKRNLVCLTAAFVLCVIVSCLLTFAGRGDGAGQQTPTYYFTNYASVEDLQLASVENESGGVVLAAIDGVFYAEGAYGLPADQHRVQTFFETMQRLPMKRLLEDADSADPQYGLNQPQAEILLQDTAQDGVLFRIGGQTPDGEGYYVGLNGDTRVFVMNVDYGRFLLSDVCSYFDLSPYPSLNDESINALQSLQVRREGEIAYAVSFSHTENSTIAAMQSPYQMTLNMAQARNALLLPLQQLEGVRVIPADGELSAYGLADDRNSFTLTYGDGTTAVISVGRQEGSETYILRQGSETILSVPTAGLSFFYGSALEIVGQNLVSVSAGDLKALQVGAHRYEISGTPPLLTVVRDGEAQPLEQFQNEVLTALNRISLQGDWDGAEQGDLLLQLTVQTGYGSADYAFYALEGRRCGVAVNGRPAFLCTRSAVQQLQNAASA